MLPIWKKAESLTKPAEIDKTSSPHGIYVRKNIEHIVSQNQDGEKTDKYSYLECFMSEAEYNNFVLVQDITSSIQLKQETQIIDNYTLKLIEEGVL